VVEGGERDLVEDDVPMLDVVKFGEGTCN